MADISIKGKSPILRQSFATGGRAGLKKGGKPWGTGPKPGTLEFAQQYLNKPRKGKSIGGAIKKVIQGGKKIISKIKGKGEKGLGSGIKPSEMHEIIPKGDRKLYLKEKLANPHKRIGKAAGGSMDPKHHKPKPPRLPRFPDKWKPRPFDFARRPEKSFIEQAGGSEKGKPHSTKEGRIASGKRKIIRALQSYSKPGGKKMGLPSRRKDFRTHGRDVPTMAAKGGRIGFKKGGSDKNWMQKVSASIKKRGTKGKCTPITKPGCTGRAKALARTFKKMGRERKAKG